MWCWACYWCDNAAMIKTNDDIFNTSKIANKYSYHTINNREEWHSQVLLSQNFEIKNLKILYLNFEY